MSLLTEESVLADLARLEKERVQKERRRKREKALRLRHRRARQRSASLRGRWPDFEGQFRTSTGAVYVIRGRASRMLPTTPLEFKHAVRKAQLAQAAKRYRQKQKANGPNRED